MSDTFDPNIDRVLAAARAALKSGRAAQPDWRVVAGDVFTALETAIARARHPDDRGRVVDVLMTVTGLWLPQDEIEAAWTGEPVTPVDRSGDAEVTRAVRPDTQPNGQKE